MRVQFHACGNAATPRAGEPAERRLWVIDENPQAKARPGCSSTRRWCWRRSLMIGTALPARAERERRAVRHAVRRRRIPLQAAQLSPRDLPGRAAPRQRGRGAEGHRAELLRLQGRSAGARRFRGVARTARKSRRSSRRPPARRSARRRPAWTASTCSPKRTSRRRSSDYYAANPQFIWVSGSSANAQGRSRRSACSALPTATGCRRPTMPSPCRRRPPMAAIRRRAWPSWCASR